jgi:hypothetical protein
MTRPDEDALRVELGAILADAAGDDPDVGALLAIMTAANPTEPDEEILARYLLGRLAAEGWRITRLDDPGPCSGGCDQARLVPLTGSLLCERCGTVIPEAVARAETRHRADLWNQTCPPR